MLARNDDDRYPSFAGEDDKNRGSDPIRRGIRPPTRRSTHRSIYIHLAGKLPIFELRRRPLLASDLPNLFQGLKIIVLL
ncbi:hypothetical protein ACS0TY_001228 [Phlomoides rotata]